MVSPHLSASSLPGTRGPQGAAALRQGALALGPGDGAGALGKKHGKMSFFSGSFMDFINFLGLRGGFYQSFWVLEVR